MYVFDPLPDLLVFLCISLCVCDSVCERALLKINK